MSNPLSMIKHIVVLMQENRGFDHMLGWLYDDEHPPAQNIPALGAGERPYEGLAGLDLNSLANKLVDGDHVYMSQPPIRGTGALDVPQWLPHEPYLDVNEQLFGSESNPAPGQNPTMTGFVQNFGSKWNEADWDTHRADIAQIMQTYTPDQLPVLHGLARFYAVSDMWFSSVPTQTNPNRAFLHCGTSLGRARNERRNAKEQFQTTTMFNVLSNHGVDWACFFHHKWLLTRKCYTRYTFPWVEMVPSVDDKFAYMTEFFPRARAGKLPAFTFIEPAWYLGFAYPGNDYHPPGYAPYGESLLTNVVAALQYNESAWQKTLLIVTFDEHGGTYDHYPPPWSATPPDTYVDPDYGEGFKFDRFGVRVPTILISPWIKESTVFRSPTTVPYDHTSIVATTLKWIGVDPTKWLGERVANAPTFEGVLNLSSPRPLAPASDALQYGVNCYVCNPFTYISRTDLAIHYWATLDENNPIYIKLQNGSGNVRNNDKVKLCSAESDIGVYNTLGSFKKDWCYFTKDEYEEQFWTIQSYDERNGSHPIKSGESVLLFDFKGRAMCPTPDDHIGVSPSGAVTWKVYFPPKVAWGEYEVPAGSGPQLAIFENTLFAVAQTASQNIAFGELAGMANIIQGVQTSARPGMATFRDRLYMAWQGKDSETGIFMSSTGDGKHWDPQQPLDGFATKSGPGLAVYDGRLYMAWQGTDNHIHYSSFDGTRWDIDHNLTDTGTSHQPALAVCPAPAASPAKHALYMTWKGGGKDEQIYWRSFDRTSWSRQTAVPSALTSCGPASIWFEDRMYLYWKGQGDDKRIFRKTFTEADGWGDQTEVRPTQTNHSPSAALYGSKLYLAFAQPASDDRNAIVSITDY
jgi:phospholipase C